MSRISPIVLLVIVILAVIFFVYGLLHFLVRYFMKRPTFSSISQSNRNSENSGSHALQRQLQQLFLLHDSGLDQALIDALPMFYYRDIMGQKEPFDCAVCLCEFSEIDILRLLPLCSHAFHINCIDTWLLSNSTCPLCRSLISPSNPTGNINNPLLNFSEHSRERWSVFPGGSQNELNFNHKQDIMQENTGDIRVFSIRLGKYRSIDEDDENGNRGNDQEEMINSCNLDGRRCYSMGTFQYIVGSELQVALSKANDHNEGLKLVKSGFEHGNFAPNCSDREGKKISARTRGDSYSVSKIWLWSKKESSQSFSDTKNVHVKSPNVGNDIIEGNQLV